MEETVEKGTETEVKTIDMRGQICPSTLLSALREVNRHQQAIRSGALRLVFLTDNRNAASTIPETARNMGYLADVMKTDGDYRIIIQGRS